MASGKMTMTLQVKVMRECFDDFATACAIIKNASGQMPERADLRDALRLLEKCANNFLLEEMTNHGG